MAEENKDNRIWLTKYRQNWWQYVLSVESLHESIGDWPDNTDVVVEFVPNPEGILKVARHLIFKGCITIGDPATAGGFRISDWLYDVSDCTRRGIRACCTAQRGRKNTYLSYQ